MAENARLDADNHIPDPMGRHTEPRSIHSPVKPARIMREPPKRRVAGLAGIRRDDDAATGSANLYQGGKRTPYWPKYNPND
jgi:hypothetical protein